ncbi:MAG: hypothetical protein VKP62_10455 [Candidatus Sericytochromatia bacterium]|nr:hypothetical protein [Candidatus Sericytochromatia bacterium]
MAARGGFTVLEIVVASSVLVTALTGVLAGALAAQRAANTTDLVTRAANLAAERLAYFRSCPNPYVAVGGTYYLPPENMRTHRDHNTAQYANFGVAGCLHNVWNETPVLLVREWLYEFPERNNRSSFTGDDVRGSKRFSLDESKRINVIPPTPAFSKEGTTPREVVGVFPNWHSATAGTALYEDKVLTIDGTGTPTRVAFLPAPIANPNLRGLSGIKDANITAANRLPDNVRYVREVWVQSNSPLGKPHDNNEGNFVGKQTYSLPTLFGTDASNGYRPKPRPVTNQVDDSEGLSVRVPLWMMTVTVRVYMRDKTIKKISESALKTAGDRTEGFGYDPKKPLAEMIGYFGLRRGEMK